MLPLAVHVDLSLRGRLPEDGGFLHEKLGAQSRAFGPQLRHDGLDEVGVGVGFLPKAGAGDLVHLVRVCVLLGLVLGGSCPLEERSAREFGAVLVVLDQFVPLLARRPIILTRLLADARSNPTVLTSPRQRVPACNHNQTITPINSRCMQNDVDTSC